jgi:hypothetical protein
MKLLDIINAQPSIQTLAETKLPVKASYRVAKMLRAFSAELVIYDQERIKLLSEYGVMAEDKSKYDFPVPENFALFNTKLADLQAEHVKMDIDLLDVEDLGSVSLEPSVIFPLIGILIKE